jgi:hypothetical protein
MIFARSARKIPMSSMDHTKSVICDKKALSIFRTIALSQENDTGVLITKLRLTRKQYYSRSKDIISICVPLVIALNI